MIKVFAFARKFLVLFSANQLELTVYGTVATLIKKESLQKPFKAVHDDAKC